MRDYVVIAMSLLIILFLFMNSLYIISKNFWSQFRYLKNEISCAAIIVFMSFATIFVVCDEAPSSIIRRLTLKFFDSIFFGWLSTPNLRIHEDWCRLLSQPSLFRRSMSRQSVTVAAFPSLIVGFVGVGYSAKGRVTNGSFWWFKNIWPFWIIWFNYDYKLHNFGKNKTLLTL